MADSDVPGLTELSATPAAGDLFHVVDVSDTSAAPDGTDKKITATNLIGAATAALASHEADTTSIHGIADTSALETTTGAQTKVDTHVNDTSAAHAASAISADSTALVGTGATVQAVFEELDDAIADHLADATDAHDASAISIVDGGGIYTGTEVETALQEAMAAALFTAGSVTAHLDDTTDAHDASAISADSTTLVGTGTDVQAVLEELDNGIADHLADTTAAHAASAVSYAGGTGMSATDVEAAIDELATEKISADGGYVQFTLTYNTLGTLALTDQASAEQLLSQNNAAIQIADLTLMRQVRLHIYVSAGSASANTPRLRVRYKTGAWSATLASYADIGTSEVACSLTTGTTAVVSSWIDLAAGALADVWVAVTQIGGDASADPAVRMVTVQFRD